MKQILFYVSLISVISVHSLSAQNDIRSIDRDLLLSPSSKSMTKGEVTFSTTDLAFHRANWAVSEQFSLGGGVVYVPTWVRPIILLNAQWNTELNENWHLGFSSNWLLPVNNNNDNLSFIAPHLALLSYTGDKLYAAAGAGAVFSDEDLSVLAQTGLIYSLSNKWSIVNEVQWGYDPTDNTYEDNLFNFSLAGRIHFDSGNLDVGVLTVILISDDGNAALPWPMIKWSMNF